MSWKKLYFQKEKKPHEKDRPTYLMFLEPDEVPEIITREEWGAAPYRDSDYVELPYNYIRFQCTGPEVCTSKEDCINFVRNMQKDHIERLKLPDIQFNYLVSPEGYIFEGRGWFRDAFREGKHDIVWKNDFLNIAFIGDYYDDNAVPMKLESALIELLKYAWLLKYLDREPIPLNHKMLNFDFTRYY